jgi:NAD(P)H-hydrate epimerase
MTLPCELYSAAQVRQLEARAVAAGVAGYTLMQRAGAAAYACMRQRWPLLRSVGVVCGPGNNGGDGMVLARLAQQEGIAVRVMLLGDPASLRGEARQAFARLGDAGLGVQTFDAALLTHCDLVVDALLGIGVRAPLRSEWQQAIEAMNACARPIFAIDTPSGLHPDSGAALPAVRADATITFIALKQGLFLRDGPEHCGELLFDALQVALPSPEEFPAVLRRLDHESLHSALPPRQRNSHKSMFGRVLIVGGGVGMPGAARLAAEAALRVGAGLVTVASLPEHIGCIVGARPELMFHPVVAGADLLPLIEGADVVAIGPGLGRDAWARDVLETVLGSHQQGQKLVIDADALNLIAEGVSLQRCDDWVLTPHPGEAARLLGVSTAEVQRDRVAALRALCASRGGTIVLKGAASLVGNAAEIPRLCDRGNAGMAVPGMGDVLTGTVAGILAQCGQPFVAAGAAVYAHALAGDRCARGGVRGVLALEVAQQLRAVLAGSP